MILEAMAKINLGLDILRKRADGYHDVKMIMQTISMHDTLDIQLMDTPGIELTANVSYIPCDENNLIYKAAKMLMDEFDIKKGVKIHLTKEIPVAAGMAGGSTDAAATFEGINKLFDLKLTDKDLMNRAVKIGADVPYCIMKGTALAEGIGEILTPIAAMPECGILVGKPGIDVSTKTAYQNLNLAGIEQHPDIDGMIEDIKAGRLHEMTAKMQNVFEPGIIAQYPVIQQIKDHMENHGALKAMMSGSGPTVFGVFDDEEKLNLACEALKSSNLAKTVYAAKIVNR